MTVAPHYINETPFIGRIVLNDFLFRLLYSNCIKSILYKKFRNALRHHTIKDTQTAMAGSEIFWVNEILSI
jgi:hypothetical protein